MVLALGLSACTTYQNFVDTFQDPIVLKCPKYLVLTDAANITKFKNGPGRDLIDVDFEGEIIGVQLGCQSDIDRDSKTGTLEVDVILRMVATRGPANRDRKARFDYFVRVLDIKGEILQGKDMTVTINFPGNKSRVPFRSQPLTLELLDISPNRTNRYYRIFTGFKTTREQLQFNRDKINSGGGNPGR